MNQSADASVPKTYVRYVVTTSSVVVYFWLRLRSVCFGGAVEIRAEQVAPSRLVSVDSRNLSLLLRI